MPKARRWQQTEREGPRMNVEHITALAGCLENAGVDGDAPLSHDGRWRRLADAKSSASASWIAPRPSGACACASTCSASKAMAARQVGASDGVCGLLPAHPAWPDVANRGRSLENAGVDGDAPLSHDDCEQLAPFWPTASAQLDRAETIARVRSSASKAHHPRWRRWACRLRSWTSRASSAASWW